jgi:hypothetical protein
MIDVKKKAGVSLSLIFVLLFAILLVSSCGGAPKKVDPAALSYGDTKIKLVGLEEKNEAVTVSDLAKLKTVSREEEAEKDSGDKIKVDATGPLLETLLAEYGKKQSDFSQIRMTAKDGYSVVLSNAQLEGDIILGIMEDGKELTKRTAPLHVIIPGERGMYWARMVTEIEFKTGGGNGGEAKAGKTFNVSNKTYSPNELIERAGLDVDKGGDVTIIADDGLKKFEKLTSFAKSKIGYEGEDAPVYLSETGLGGMKVKHIDKIQIGETIFEF